VLGREIPGRKQRQIEAFAAAAPVTGRPVLDWCGGKGHLGRLLALHWQTPVTTLEIDPALCAAGEALAERQALAHEFLVADALTADIPAGRHAVALHACGELHRRLVEGAADAGLAGLDVAPCCYHRGIADAYRPLSGPLRTELSRDDTRLAVTETVTASPRLARQRDREMAWKLAFAEWQRQTLGAYRNFRPVPAAWFRAAFPEFLAAMAARAGLPLPSAARPTHARRPLAALREVIPVIVATLPARAGRSAGARPCGASGKRGYACNWPLLPATTDAGATCCCRTALGRAFSAARGEMGASSGIVDDQVGAQVDGSRCRRDSRGGGDRDATPLAADDVAPVVAEYRVSAAPPSSEQACRMGSGDGLAAASCRR
jgi:hypothetical protein